MHDTAKQILDLAENLWLERGFNGFSYQHLAEPLGLQKAAIHYHYPSKTDLGLALLGRMQRRFARSTQGLCATHEDPWLKLEWYFDLLSHNYAESERICPTGMLAAEWASLPEPLREAAQQLMQQLYAWCVAVLQEGMASGHFRFVGAPEDKAAAMLACLQGALQIARFEASWLDAIKKQLRLELGARQGPI